MVEDSVPFLDFHTNINRKELIQLKCHAIAPRRSITTIANLAVKADIDSI